MYVELHCEHELLLSGADGMCPQLDFYSDMECMTFI